jgi:hypothetical protein
MADRLGELTAAGVAIWLDDLSRARLATGSPANSCLTCVGAAGFDPATARV